jgi:hypothetical protein
LAKLIKLNIVPISKEQPGYDVNKDLRPISLASVLYKIAEDQEHPLDIVPHGKILGLNLSAKLK